jgi:hypothetical protein
MKFIKENKYVLILLLTNLLTLVFWVNSGTNSIKHLDNRTKFNREIDYLISLSNDSVNISTINLDSIAQKFDPKSFKLFTKLIELKIEANQMRDEFYAIQSDLSDSLFQLLNVVNNTGKFVNVQKQKDLIISTLKGEINNKVIIYDSIISQMQNDIVSYQSKLEEFESISKNTGFLTFKSVSGATIYYVGEINQENKAEGYGIAIWESGHRYEGQWKDGLKHGTGIYFFKNGEKYEGEYIKNQRSGKGKYYFVNGDYYDGNWFADQRNGTGKIILSKGGEKQNGIWENDKFIK